MKPYADTNFLMRLYLQQTESPHAARALQTPKLRRPIPITWLHRMEFANALEISVWLGKQGTHPAVTPQQAAVALATFQDDLQSRTFLTAASPPMDELEQAFEQMSHRHTAHHGFRTYDVVHVASAILLGCNAFFSFDTKARKLAALEGLSLPA